MNYIHTNANTSTKMYTRIYTYTCMYMHTCIHVDTNLDGDGGKDSMDPVHTWAQRLRDVEVWLG